jgi:RpiR family transcriptional regulator, carbohydrate utilization regulator
MARKRTTTAKPAKSGSTEVAPGQSLLDRIEAGMESLRPSEQAVAQYILRHPNQVIDLAFPEIAHRAGVSQPTVARFCLAFGFAGYRDFKLRLAQSLAGSVPFVHRDVGLKDSAAEIGAKVFDRSIAAMVHARNHLDPANIRNAATLLARAKRIEFYGSGNSGIVAQDAQHKFMRLGPPTAAYSDPHLQLVAAALLDADAVVVAISGSGSTVDLLEAVGVAREAGAKIVAITASGSPLTELADVLLRADVPEDLDVYAPMSSRLVHLALIDVLAVAVAVERGPALGQKLKRAKQVLSERRIDEFRNQRRA